MPSTKSAFKRMRSNEKKRLHNKSVKSALKTSIKKVVSAMQAKDGELTKSLITEAFSKLDKASKTGVIHKNTANREKSRLSKRANSLAKPAAKAE